MKDILLFDRIKETTRITGTSDIILDGASSGFSAFSDYLSVGENVFYAITDGQQYEVGSGTFDGSNIVRNPLRTSNPTNSIISFSAGLKEVYATYPGAFAVISNPLDTPQVTRESGITYWSGPQTIDSDSEFVWDETNKRLGVNVSNPISSVHIGGDNTSELRVSGITVGVSGINFGEVGFGYFSGRQREPFIKNSLCEETSGILNLSGDVDQIICFNSQPAGTFLGVPSGVCPDGCLDNHPIFRTLSVEDIPSLSGLYVFEDQYAEVGSGHIAYYKDVNSIDYSDALAFDTTLTPNELIVSGIIRFPDADNSFITGGYIAGTGLELEIDNRTINMLESGRFSILEITSGIVFRNDGDSEIIGAYVGGSGIELASDKKTFNLAGSGELDQLQITSGILFPNAGNSQIVGSYIGGSGIELAEDDRTFNLSGSGKLDQLEILFTDQEPQLISNSGSANNSNTENVIINQSGFLTIPTFDLVTDVVNSIPPSNTGVIAFASGDSFIMIANGTSWVSGQLI